MKYGFAAFGKMREGLTRENMIERMEEARKVAEKYEIKLHMYGFPFGTSENFYAMYSSDKGLDNYINFVVEAELPYTDTRTHQIRIL